MGIETSVSTGHSLGSSGNWVVLVTVVSIVLGGAAFMLLRSRCPSFEMRADWSREYDEDILPM